MEQVRSLKTGLKYKDTPIGRIPVDWEIASLGKIAKFEYGASLPEQKRTNGNFPVYGSNGIVGYHGEALANGPGIVIGRKGTVGAITWADDSFWPIDTTYYITKKQSKVYLKWLFYLLSDLHLERLNITTGVPGLNREQTHLVTIAIPPFIEQERIAEILITVDHAIEKTNQIIEKTKELKRGLMQHLLTRGIRHTKFKKSEIGEIPEDWKLVHLGDIAKIERGRFSHRPRNAPQFYGGDIPFVQTADIVNSNGRLRNYSQTLNDLGLSISKVFPKGTILITIAANIGHTGILEFDSACPDSLIGISPYESISATYLHYYLSGQQKSMEVIAPQCAQKNINIQILKSWRVLLPSIEEQERIANTLLTVDDEIEKESSRKEELETLKKGLMQVLLTGKLRVAV